MSQPPRFVTLPEIRRAARGRLPREVWNFGDGGAETETTLRRNRRHLDRLAIQQHVLVDVRQIDLRTSLLGVPLAWPVSVAPMGGLILFHPEGDVEMARGAAKADTLQWVSGATGWPVEEVAKAGAAPQMFQLYHHGDRGWVGELLARVEASGYLAVALTVDVQLYGRRERDILARWSPRKAMEIAPNPRGPTPEYQARLTWDDVLWLMKTTKLPVGLKGIMTVRDARRAADMGVRLIWVSNHGGRKLDQTQSTIDALPAIADAVGDRVDIVVDGSFSRGTEVVKGLARGAKVAAVAAARYKVNSNAAVIVTDDGVVVVDSHSKPSAARALYTEIQGITKKPVRKIVNTHFHWDHWQGNEVYKAANPGLEIVASQRTQENLTRADAGVGGVPYIEKQLGALPGEIDKLKDDARRATDPTTKARIEANLEQAEAYLSELKQLRPTLPTRTVSTTVNLREQGREIQLHLLGRGHTDGDLYVYLPKEKVVATGDALIDWMPFLNDGYPEEWVQTLSALEQLDFTHITRSHGA